MMSMRSHKTRFFAYLAVLLILLAAFSGCATTPSTEDVEHEGMPDLSAVSLAEGERLRVVATTSIVYDVVANVGGELIDLTMLIPLGTDPHGFEPRPQDVAAISEAHVIFANGMGLEEFLDPLLESAGAAGSVVHVSHGVDFLETEDEEEEHQADEHDHAGTDPHTWMNPNNVKVWVQNIETALSALDPDNTVQYQFNAADYTEKLQVLDEWIRQRVADIPETDRRLVTDHLIFAYLADAYGFEQVGAVIPGYSSLAEPSAQELAELVDAIQEFEVKAILVGGTVNPNLSQSIAQDTGAELIFVYTGSLSEPGAGAETYLDYMRFNVNAIVQALG